MPHLRKRRLLLAALGAALIAVLALAPGAFADAITPESGGSPQADDVDTLFKITLYVAIVIFLIVEGTLIWSLLRYRLRRSGPAAVQVRGNTPLELAWTVGAALILVVLATVTFLYLPEIKDPPPSDPDGLQASSSQVAAIDQADPPRGGGPTLNIDVNGQQYVWRYDYPGRPQLISYHDLVVPTGTTVTLDITASDVIHSWWIPKLGGKVDGVPGHTAETWFKISKPGVYEGQCAELCGSGHADMRAVVRAVTPEDYEAWADRQREDISAAQDDLARQREEREQSEEGGG